MVLYDHSGHTINTMVHCGDSDCSHGAHCCTRSCNYNWCPLWWHVMNCPNFTRHSVTRSLQSQPWPPSTSSTTAWPSPPGRRPASARRWTRARWPLADQSQAAVWSRDTLLTSDWLSQAEVFVDSVRNSATGGGSELRGALKQLRRVNRSNHHHHQQHHHHHHHAWWPGQVGRRRWRTPAPRSWPARRGSTPAGGRPARPGTRWSRVSRLSVYLHYWPLAPCSPGPGPHQPGGGGPVGQQPLGVRTPWRGQDSRRGRPGEGRSWHLISMWLSSSSQDPRCLKVLLVKAEALFDSRSFEHSLLYFYQAAKLSPNNKTAHEGISKCCRTIQHKLRKNAFTSVKCLLTYLADADGEKSIDSFLDSFYLENRRFGKISRGDHFMKLIHGDKHFLMHLKLQLQREKVSPDNILSVLTESEKYLGKREVFWSALWRGGLHIQTIGFFNFVIDIVWRRFLKTFTGRQFGSKICLNDWYSCVK